MSRSSSLSSSPMQSPTAWKTFFRADVLSITLKFGFHQNRMEYSISDTSNSIIERVYRDADQWVRKIASSFKNAQMVGRYTMYLFRIPATEFTMIPIVQQSDIEHNCLVEIILVPIEMNQRTHSLYPCQLNKPTNCSKCSRFIRGLYRQGFRCHKCRMTFHKNCTPFLLDDCPAQISGDQTAIRKESITTSPQLIIVNPFVTDPTPSPDKTTDPLTTIVPIYTTSTSTATESPQLIAPTTIIAKGIFPACTRGAHIYRRYLFFLTTNTLSMTTNLSAINARQPQSSSQSGEIEQNFPLINISDLVLTHFMDGRDDVFEIHLRNKTVLSIGKKTDSDDLQMETAQFYSWIRDQWESLINATPPSSQASNTPPTQEVVTTIDTQQECPTPLNRRISNYRRPPRGKDNEDKDFYELYEITGERIGEGQFGRVIGVCRKSTHQDAAVKIIEKTNCGEQDIRRINEEIDHLYKFNHVNILKLEAYFERDNAVYLVTERMETDMYKYIINSKNRYLNEDTSRMIIYQVIVALRYLHGKDCVHLDIKCENILITLLKPIQNGVDDSRDFPLVKLADFGYSRIIGEHSFRKTRVGTKVYNAPEIYRSKEGYNRLVDMWSVGIVLYAALSGTLPYDETNFQHAEEIVRDKKVLFAGKRWAQTSKEAIDLISSKLLVIQPTSRIKSSDALFHDWFTDFLLYKNLREIEKRTKYMMSIRQQEFPSASTWLTGEREDLVWTEYKNLCAQSKEQNNT